MSEVCLHIISKEEAKKRGMNKYFTGKPCKRGHLSERYTGSGHCITCTNEKKQKKRDEIKESQKVLLSDEEKELLEDFRELVAMDREMRAKKRAKQYHEDNRNRMIEATRKWREENREHYNAYRKEHSSRPHVRAQMIPRIQLRRVLELSKQKKDGKSFDMLGFTPEEFSEHIEMNWQEGMSWDNYGEWHIDHIYPVSRYIEDGETNPAVINSLNNLLPMWAEHNIAKGNKTLEEFLEIRPDLEGMYKLKESPSSGN